MANFHTVDAFSPVTAYSAQSRFKSGKYGVDDGAVLHQPPICPECGSAKVWKDGLRKIDECTDERINVTQRWLCRSCGLRFSQSQNNKKENRQTIQRRVCDAETEGSRNLATVQVPEKAGQREATETADVKGKIVEYIWHLKKQGYRPATIRNYGGHVKHLVKLGADLFDPESVKETIATQTWKDGSKAQYVVAYEIFLEIVGLEWNPPRYKIRESLPFIPLTSELDALINSCGKKVACFLQGLKDTGADPGELAALEWTDLNFEAKSVTIKYPVKGHNPRVLPISNTFIGRLNAMPKKNARVFSTYRALLNNYAKQRQKIAHELSNPRILKIQFRTFRHWKGTMEYHLTRDPYHVKKILGHKRLSSTEIYINLEQALFTEADEGYHFKVAENVEEAGKLIEAGFEYVGRIHGSEVFRKRKSGQFDAQVVTFVQKPSQVETSPANSPSPSFFVFYVVKFFVTGRADDSAASEPNSFQEGRR